MGRSALRVGPHHNHAKSALCGACSAVSRPLRHGAIRARDVRHGTRTRWSRPLESPAVDWSKCWCGRASADCVGRSAPRVGPHHNHAKSALRGALRGPSAATPWCDTRAERAPQDSNALFKTLRILHHQSVAVLCGRASADSVGRSAARVGPYHNHAKVRAAQRVLRRRLADSPRGEIRTSHVPRGSIAVVRTSRRPCC